MLVDRCGRVQWMSVGLPEDHPPVRVPVGVGRGGGGLIVRRTGTVTSVYGRISPNPYYYS